ncbi:hypothetical protein M3580_12170 [Bacillus safensis]|uniref:hypothetical protein n=1 Tax=Bacillus safensis TaxID=561879 RepID=UPI002041DE57|nr:hypothetical protein [Bacillus safensis]MCM2989980.1 hypothetical protein [Bacillus safensis]
MKIETNRKGFDTSSRLMNAQMMRVNKAGFMIIFFALFLTPPNPLNKKEHHRKQNRKHEHIQQQCHAFIWAHKTKPIAEQKRS